MAAGSSDSTAIACRCRHGADAHEHFRRGTECALCGCARFCTTRLAPLARFLTRRGVRRDTGFEPEPQPQLQPQAQPQVQPQVQPQAQPQAQPQVQPQTLAS